MHYGLEKGDKVKIFATVTPKICEVVDFSPTDNNKVYLKDESGTFEYVCEWCQKISQV